MSVSKTTVLEIMERISELEKNSELAFKCMWVLEKDNKSIITQNSNGIFIPVGKISDHAMLKLKKLLKVPDSDSE